MLRPLARWCCWPHPPLRTVEPRHAHLLSALRPVDETMRRLRLRAARRKGDTTAIDGDLVRRLVGEQFPRYRELPVTPVVPGGHDNRTFRVGGSLCARLPSASRYAPRLLTEHEWLPRLAGHLPLPIPQPVALGTPGAGYPWHWALNRWTPGEPATRTNIRDLRDFAYRLASFLVALQGVDAAGAPAPGPENFHRGGEFTIYEPETDLLLDRYRDLIDHRAALETWRRALGSRWEGNPVWVHGDVAAGNLLVQDGQLHAVIDFGQLAAGDPACDLTVAWTLLDADSRAIFAPPWNSTAASGSGRAVGHSGSSSLPWTRHDRPAPTTRREYERSCR